jgi:hypothetical protein
MAPRTYWFTRRVMVVKIRRLGGALDITRWIAGVPATFRTMASREAIAALAAFKGHPLTDDALASVVRHLHHAVQRELARL